LLHGRRHRLAAPADGPVGTREDPDDLLNVIAASPVMDSTMAANAELYAVARGERPAEKWLAEHGHRAPAEFDLATPRWRERIDEVRTMASALAQGKSPLEVHHTRVKQAEAKVAELKKSLDAKSVTALEGVMLDCPSP
jgi:lysozyme family protein